MGGALERVDRPERAWLARPNKTYPRAAQEFSIRGRRTRCFAAAFSCRRRTMTVAAAERCPVSETGGHYSKRTRCTSFELAAPRGAVPSAKHRGRHNAETR